MRIFLYIGLMMPFLVGGCSTSPTPTILVEQLRVTHKCKKPYRDYQYEVLHRVIGETPKQETIELDCISVWEDIQVGYSYRLYGFGNKVTRVELLNR